MNFFNMMKLFINDYVILLVLLLCVIFIMFNLCLNLFCVFVNYILYIVNLYIVNKYIWKIVN